MGWIVAPMIKDGHSHAFTMGPARWLWMIKPISFLPISTRRSSKASGLSSVKVFCPRVGNWQSGCWESLTPCSIILATHNTRPDICRFFRNTISKSVRATGDGRRLTIHLKLVHFQIHSGRQKKNILAHSKRSPGETERVIDRPRCKVAESGWFNQPCFSYPSYSHLQNSLNSFIFLILSIASSFDSINNRSHL